MPSNVIGVYKIISSIPYNTPTRYEVVIVITEEKIRDKIT